MSIQGQKQSIRIGQKSQLCGTWTRSQSLVCEKDENALLVLITEKSPRNKTVFGEHLD